MTQPSDKSDTAKVAMTIDLTALRELIARRGDCAGPMTTFPAPHVAHVAIVCRDNWGEVICWLAACEKSMPLLLDRVESLEAEVVRLKALVAEACGLALKPRDRAAGHYAKPTAEDADRIAAIKQEAGCE